MVFAAGWMVSGSSTLSVDVKQQRTLSPAQTNRLNVTLIWRLNRIFLTRRTLRASAERVGFLVLKEKMKKIPRNVQQWIQSASKEAACANLYDT